MLPWGRSQISGYQWKKTVSIIDANHEMCPLHSLHSCIPSAKLPSLPLLPTCGLTLLNFLLPRRSIGRGLCFPSLPLGSEPSSEALQCCCLSAALINISHTPSPKDDLLWYYSPLENGTPSHQDLSVSAIQHILSEKRGYISQSTKDKVPTLCRWRRADKQRTS